MDILKNQIESEQELSVGRISLSSHSGGWRVILQILNNGDLGDSISSIIYMDCLFGSQIGFWQNWLTRSQNPPLNFYSVFSDFEGVEPANLELLRNLRIPQVSSNRWYLKNQVTNSEIEFQKILINNQPPSHTFNHVLTMHAYPELLEHTER